MLQYSPSSHGWPFIGAVAFTHTSPASSQESTVHWSTSSHRLSSPPTHDPALQVSPTVQNSPSSHAVPSIAAASFTHAPPASSQESCVQKFPSSHRFADPPWHTPPRHVSPMLQYSPSSHGWPSTGAVAFTQMSPKSSQLSCVQCSPSSHS